MTSCRTITNVNSKHLLPMPQSKCLSNGESINGVRITKVGLDEHGIVGGRCQEQFLCARLQKIDLHLIKRDINIYY